MYLTMLTAYTLTDLYSTVMVITKKIGRVRNRTGDLSHAKGARYRLRHALIFVEFVVLRARVIPECLDNPNINSLREVTSCQNGLSD